jgi:DNA (cytosine-5)-methyltransferase 1
VGGTVYGNVQVVVDERPTHIDLFSGIGGFTLACEAAGFKTIAFCENSERKRKTLQRRFPKIPIYRDIRTIPACECDLITGGFPCQPFSFAGKRRGSSDDRFLWPPMLDFIRRSNPIAVLGENVTGINNMELDRIIVDLEAIGFWAIPFDVPACAVGAFHLRRRTWIVAYNSKKRGERSSEKKICRQSSLQGIENGGRIAHKFERPSLFTPTLCGKRDGLSSELGCFGDAIVPQVAEVFAKAIYEQIQSER